MTRRDLSLLPVAVMIFSLLGCGSAPNVDILGSFFPVWMLCVAAAIPLTFAVRLVLVRFKLESEVGPLALFYPFAVILFSSLLWLVFFG